MFNLQGRLMKWIGLSLLFLASLGFVLLGMGNLSFGDRAATVAKVAGHEITENDWDRAHSQTIDRLLSENPDLSLAALDTPAMRYGSLQGLVRDYVLSVAAESDHLAVSDSRLVAALQNDPTIAGLSGDDGQLDLERYERLLAARGMSVQGFEEGLRASLSRDQVLAGVYESELASPAQIQVALDALLAQREVRVVRFGASDYGENLEPSDEQLQDYYQAHLQQYQAPESVDIAYLVLDMPAIEDTIRISEQELRDYYEQNKASFETPEERRASHILIQLPSDASKAQRDQALERAQEIAEQLRAAPDTFAEVARESSDDTASAESGGDLGSFQRDRGMDATIAAAAFDLEAVGDISDPVATDFGYHILRLTDITPATAKPFDNMRAQLEQQFREQQAQTRFSEMAEEFTNSVYEQPDSLEPTAERLGLKVQMAEGVTREPAADATGALANPKFLKALFSTDALKNDNNTEATEVGTNELAAGHVRAHTPAHAIEFDQVREQIEDAWRNEQGALAARKEGQDKLKAWKADPATATELPEAIVLSREDMHEQPLELVEAVLRTNPDQLPTFVGVDLGNEGYAVVQIEKTLPTAELDADEEERLRASYRQLASQAETGSYYEYLRARYKARILVPQPENVSADDLIM